MLDATSRTRRYAGAVRACREALDDPQRLPSARVLDELRSRSEAFFEFAMRKSEEHRASLLAETLPPGRKASLEAEATASLRTQREIEAADRLSFSEYLERYFAQRPRTTSPAAAERTSQSPGEPAGSIALCGEP